MSGQLELMRARIEESMGEQVGPRVTREFVLDLIDRVVRLEGEVGRLRELAKGANPRKAGR